MIMGIKAMMWRVVKNLRLEPKKTTSIKNNIYITSILEFHVSVLDFFVSFEKFAVNQKKPLGAIGC